MINKIYELHHFSKITKNSLLFFSKPNQEFNWHWTETHFFRCLFEKLQPILCEKLFAAHTTFKNQVFLLLRKGKEFKSISKFLIGNRFHITLHIVSPTTGKKQFAGETLEGKSKSRERKHAQY